MKRLIAFLAGPERRAPESLEKRHENAVLRLEAAKVSHDAGQTPSTRLELDAARQAFRDANLDYTAPDLPLLHYDGASLVFRGTWKAVGR